MKSSAPLLLIFVLLSAAAHAGSAIEIPRTAGGTLPAGATRAAVEAMLVGARFYYANPDKLHSTWESKWLAFDSNGSVDVTTAYAFGPRTVKALWHVVRAGSAPIVDIDGVAYALAPCSFDARTTCLVGPRP